MALAASYPYLPLNIPQKIRSLLGQVCFVLGAFLGQRGFSCCCPCGLFSSGAPLCSPQPSWAAAMQPVWLMGDGSFWTDFSFQQTGVFFKMLCILEIWSHICSWTRDQQSPPICIHVYNIINSMFSYGFPQILHIAFPQRRCLPNK